MKSIGIILLIVFGPAFLLSHPVIYKGGVVVETENSIDMNEYHLGYSFLNTASVAGHYIKEGAVELQFVQLNYLVNRWNNDDSQANIYVTGALGAERKLNSWTAAQLVEIDMDWENRDYYFLGKQRFVARHSNADDTNKVDLWHSRVRAGIAPFRSDVNDLGIWFIMQFDKHNEKNWTTTQLMRFYYKTALWELGANLNGSYQLNFMIHL